MHIFNLLAHNKLPRHQDIAKRTLLAADHYTYRNNILYHVFEPKQPKTKRMNSMILQICVPKSKRFELLQHFHDNVTFHSSFQKLYLTIRQTYYWSSLLADSRTFIDSCITCQTCKPDWTLKPTPLHPLPVAPLFHRYSLDALEGIPPTKKGNKAILVCVETYSQFVELEPVSDLTAVTVAQFLFKVICRYGVPGCVQCSDIFQTAQDQSDHVTPSILCDKGPGFSAKLSRALCDLLHCHHRSIASGNARSNSSSELRMKQIGKCLRIAAANGDVDAWESYLPIAAASINQTTNTSLGISPHEILYGVKPLDIFTQFDAETSNKKFDAFSYLSELRKRTSQIRDGLKDTILANQQQNIAYHDKNAQTTLPQVGDLVLLQTNRIKHHSKNTQATTMGHF
jgi:Integrase zinc binding domain